MRHLVFQNCTRKNENKKLSYSAVAQKNLSVKDLQRQILTLQKQVLRLTSLLAKKQQKRVNKPIKSKEANGKPATKPHQVSHVDAFKWQTCKRFTVSRKGLPPSKAIAYAVRDGKFYLKLIRREVCLLSKVTRLSFKSVHLTSKKTMRAVLTGESKLRLTEKPKDVRRGRVSAKGNRRERTVKCQPVPVTKGTKAESSKSLGESLADQLSGEWLPLPQELQSWLPPQFKSVCYCGDFCDLYINADKCRIEVDGTIFEHQKHLGRVPDEDLLFSCLNRQKSLS